MDDKEGDEEEGNAGEEWSVTGALGVSQPTLLGDL